MLNSVSSTFRRYIHPTKRFVLDNQTKKSYVAFANTTLFQCSYSNEIRSNFHAFSTGNAPIANNMNNLKIRDRMKVNIKPSKSMQNSVVSFRSLSTTAYTKEMQDMMTPDSAFEELKKGNKRFLAKSPVDRDLLEQVDATSSGQFPYATVLSCIDSRTSSELIFDQGIGDIFSIRIAGNFVNDDILGSMVFTCKLAGTKLIVVLGHTACGAVKGACDHARLGNLTTLINKIEPAVAAVKEPLDESLRNSSNATFVDEVAAQNVRMTMDNIRSSSEILAGMEKKGEIKIVGGMYDVGTGKVNFFP